MPVGPRRRRQHQRVRRPLGEDGAHLAEVVGDQVDGPGPEARPRHVGQEVRDVTEAVTERAVQVGPVVDGVHLVDADAVEVGCVGLDGIEQGHRLAVRQRHDQVGPRPDVLEHRVGRGRCRHCRSRDHRDIGGPVLRIGTARSSPVT